MTISQNLNELVKAITGANGTAVTISDGLKEFIRALDAGESITPADDTISELLQIIAAVLPGKLGITPAGELAINENGTYDVTNYASAIVNVPDYKSDLVNLVSRQITSFDAAALQIQKIGAYAFANCIGLTSFDVPENQGIQRISKYAFLGCISLKSVVIHSWLIYIDEGAFSGCTNLEDIYIPKQVETIGDNAFYNCSGLTDVYFSGTEQEWNAITISSTGNDALTAATKHYEVFPSA